MNYILATTWNCRLIEHTILAARVKYESMNCNGSTFTLTLFCPSFAARVLVSDAPAADEETDTKSAAAKSLGNSSMTAR